MEHSFELIAQDIIDNHIDGKSLLIGLGSGRAVSKIVNILPQRITEKCEFICTSIQIKIEAERKKLKLLDETMIPYVDLVIDGADQIDKDLFMIKGGGGALLREKILFQSSKRKVIVADFSKFVETFCRAVPVEILPFSRTSVIYKVKDKCKNSTLRTIDRGYPYITENGNLILDVEFDDYTNIVDIDASLKMIPGILETGLFLEPATVYYEALENADFKIHYSSS